MTLAAGSDRLTSLSPSERRERISNWYAVQINAWLHLSPVDRADLEAWDHNRTRHQATSDWPRWGEFIDMEHFWPWEWEQRGPFEERTPRPAKERSKALIPLEIRWAVWVRDDFTCRHCGSRSFLSVDHIVAESRGGTLDLDNLQTLCRSCNSRKGNR